MNKSDWMERMCSLQDPLALRIMSAAVAFLNATAEPEARRIALVAAMGCTFQQLDDAHAELVAAGLAEEIGNGWLQ